METSNQARRWVNRLELHEPAQVTSFLLGLGYDEDKVVNTLVKRCNLTPSEATRYVKGAQQGGQQ